MQRLKDYNQAWQYLLQRSNFDNVSKIQGKERVRFFLQQLANPQNKYKSFHVVGTSGKGSTAFALSKLLVAHGFRVGLKMSPHVIDVRERSMINNKFIPKRLFLQYLNELLPLIEEINKTKYGPLSYLDILTVLSFYIFKKQKVDYAVIESGVGGINSRTNNITRQDKVLIITRIGLDHLKILGNTISKITTQKARAINSNSYVVALEQKEVVNKIIVNEAKLKKAFLKVVGSKNIKTKKINQNGSVFDFCFNNSRYNDLKISFLGAHQIENTSLALASLELTSSRDKFEISETKVRRVLNNLSLPARLDIINYNNRKVIIDGAHNFQKIKALVKALQEVFPKQKFTVILAIKIGKNSTAMLKQLIPVTNNMIITNFLTSNINNMKMSQDPWIVASVLDRLDFKNYQIVDSIAQAINVIGKNSQVLVTGSLYLAADLYSIAKQKNND